MKSLIFVGDIHGDAPKLRELLELSSGSQDHFVFLGDYVNKGPESAQVLQLLLDASKNLSLTLIAGNHDLAFLQVLEGGPLGPFLKMGGAATVRSYIPGPVGPDVGAELREAVPKRHLALLRSLVNEFLSTDVFAAHRMREGTYSEFQVSGHNFIGTLPKIDERSARIDTGCGSPGGRLTAFRWPSREFFQIL